MIEASKNWYKGGYIKLWFKCKNIQKEFLTYKLGEAMIEASKNWYKGGYIKLLLDIKKMKG